MSHSKHYKKKYLLLIEEKFTNYVERVLKMKEEVTKKRGPIYKKWWFWLILIVVVLGPIFSSMEEEERAEEEKKEVQQEETNDDNKEQEEKLDKKIELEDEILFTNFTINMDDARVYEEDGKTYIDVSFDWLNNSFEDKTTFMRAAGIDVHQGEELLEETSDAYNDKQSDVYFPNAVGGKIGVTLTYELVDTENDVRLVFVPRDEYDDTEEVIININ